MRISVGTNIDSFVLHSITSTELLEATNSTVVVYLNMDANDRWVDYYRGIKAVLTNNNNKLLLLLAPEEPNLTQMIINLCLLYNTYDIYKQTPGIEITKDYIDELLSRTTSKDEVQMYISKEAVAIDSVSEALLKLRELSEEGNFEELQNYVIGNLDLIKEYPSILDSLRALLDPLDKIKEEDFKQLEKEYAKVQSDLKQAMADKAKLGESLRDKAAINKQLQDEIQAEQGKVKKATELYSKLSEEAEGLKNENNRLKDTLEKSDSIGLSLYSTIRMSAISGNKAKVVIYFKEIGRPRYFNTLIKYLMFHLNKLPASNGKVKLMIYDSRKDFSVAYADMKVASEENYFAERIDIINRNQVVFMDTNPGYLGDSFTQGPYEYFIIVDRLGKKEDLVEGSNVIKFWTFYSKHEYMNYMKRLGDIPPLFSILTDSPKTKDVINILTVLDYPQTETAQYAKYFKMVNTSSSKTIFEEILSKCGISAK